MFFQKTILICKNNSFYFQHFYYFSTLQTRCRIIPFSIPPYANYVESYFTIKSLHLFAIVKGNTVFSGFGTSFEHANNTTFVMYVLQHDMNTGLLKILLLIHFLYNLKPLPKLFHYWLQHIHDDLSFQILQQYLLQ